MAEKKQDWFESESFWAQYSPVLFDAKRWAEAPSVAEGVLRIIGAPVRWCGSAAKDHAETALREEASESEGSTSRVREGEAAQFRQEMAERQEYIRVTDSDVVAVQPLSGEDPAIAEILGFIDNGKHRPLCLPADDGGGH